MTISIQQWNKFIQCESRYYTPHMKILLDNIDSVINNPVKVLKNDRTSTVVVVKVDEQLFVIKRANTKSKIHFLRRLFWRSRARKNWDYAHKLLSLGFKTFQPVALLEERWGLFRKRSYFICSYIQGIDALNYFACGANPIPEWRIVAKDIGLLLKQLAECGISHRDLNLSNIILKDNKPWLIDLDGMRQHRWQISAKRGAKRERARFMENWEEAPGVSSEVIPLFQSVFNELDQAKN